MSIDAIASNGYATQISEIYSRMAPQQAQDAEGKKSNVPSWGEDTVAISLDARELQAQLKEPALPDLPVMFKVNGVFHNLFKNLSSISQNDPDKGLSLFNGLSHQASEQDFINAISELTGASVADVKKAFANMSAKEAEEFAKQMGDWMKVDSEEYLKALKPLCNFSNFALQKELSNEQSMDKTIMGLLNNKPTQNDPNYPNYPIKGEQG